MRWKGVPARGHIILLVSLVNEIMTEICFTFMCFKMKRLPRLLSAKPRHEKVYYLFEKTDEIKRI